MRDAGEKPTREDTVEHVVGVHVLLVAQDQLAVRDDGVRRRAVPHFIVFDIGIISIVSPPPRSNVIGTPSTNPNAL